MPDIVTTRVFSDGEKGITATKMNDIIGSSVIQTSFVSSKPVASSTAAGDNLLLLKSGGTYAQIDSSAFATAMVPLLPDPNPKIWSARLRSFNAIGNPTFEVDQRNCNNSVSYGAGTVTGFICDRWNVAKVLATGTAFPVCQVIPGGPTNVPGTSFAITRSRLLYQTSAAQGTLAAGEYAQMLTYVEGPRFRELINDVHSLQLLVSCDISPLKFSVSIRDFPATKSIVYLCTYTGGVQLITIPNIPVFPAGNFSTAPGAAGYQLSVNVACGSTLTAPAAGSWQSGNFLGAPGMDNFAANASKNFYVYFIQHEPGPLCTTPMDCPFTQNYDDSLRYFCKSYDYGTKAGTVTYVGQSSGYGPVGWSSVWGVPRFPKPMAKAPAVSIYNSVSGAINSATDGGTTYATTGGQDVGLSGFSHFSINPNVAAGAAPIYFHFTSDTGW
jgi:hypothetical protein